MPHVFTYGSLMFDPVWSFVVAGDYDRCVAILPGYERKSVRGEVYPVVIPTAGHSQVPGILYFDVSASDMARLDTFERKYYFRRTEQVITLDKAAVAAEVYVLSEEYYAMISHVQWDPVHFSTTDLELFIQNYMDPDGRARKDN
jgi:gamma-glutamylcyclotransferase (GGCT)/AIG2-like uncharacterized protein YtfP